MTRSEVQQCIDSGEEINCAQKWARMEIRRGKEKTHLNTVRVPYVEFGKTA